jgi:hypothetical protein
MATTSRWAAVVNALIDTMRATSGYRAPGADGLESLIPVFDGPEWEMSDDNAQTFLIIGGTVETDEAGAAQQAFGPIGNRARDESGNVMCNAVAQLGNVNLKDSALDSTVTQDTWRTLRATAFGIAGAVEDALRADPSIGITNVPRMLAQIGSTFEPKQYLADRGAFVSLVFTVDYDTRI